jgi:hypothetical protein
MLKMSFISKTGMVATALAVIAAVFSTTSVLAAPAKSSSAVSTDAAQVWRDQSRELRTDMEIYDKYRLHVEDLTSSTKPAEIQQYLDEYGMALQQADAIISHSLPSSSNNLSINKSPQRELATYLHLMRGLQAKIGNL